MYMDETPQTSAFWSFRISIRTIILVRTRANGHAVSQAHVDLESLKMFDNTNWFANIRVARAGTLEHAENPNLGAECVRRGHVRR